MKNHLQTYADSRQNRNAAQVALLYLVIGSLWILFSDKLAAKIAPNQATLTVISIYKGWGYVIVTALILYWLIRRANTERERAEVRLQEDEKRYRQFFENMHEMFIIQEVVVDEAGKPIDLRYLDVNPAAEHFIGKTRSEIVGKTREQLVGRPDPEGVEMAGRVASTGTPSRLVRYSPGFGGWFESFTYSLGSGVVATRSMEITERKQAEEAQYRSETRLNGIITSAMDAIISVDSEQIIVLFNAAAEKMFGCLASEAMGKPLESFIPGRFRAAHAEHIRIFGETGVTNRAMNALGVIFGLRANGEEFPIEASISQIEIDEKKLYTVILRDITERKWAEAELKESEERFTNAFHASPVPQNITVQSTGEILAVNKAFCQLFEYSHEELIGNSTIKLRMWENPADREAAIHELVTTGHLLPIETTIRTRSGQIRTVIVSVEPIVWKGKPCSISSMIDITDRKQAEDALHRSQENFIKAFNSNPAAIAITRLTDGKFISINPAYLQIMGYERHEILDHTAAEMHIYVHPGERDQVVQQLREQGAVQNYELLVRVKSGETRNIVISMVPILYNQEECILSVFLDISARKKMEQELQRSNAELEQFAYVASHDLQEPLRAVAGMVQLLQQRYQGKLDERADEYIGHAVDAATRMQKLINDLLDYSRVNRLGQSFEYIEGEKSLSAALANLQIAIQESQAEITHDPLPTLVADRGQLTQVLQNLIGNAIKFRGTGPLHIHIGTKKIESGWQFSVSDNGIGIEPQYYQRIFLIFQRLHTRREYPGTGIGLALCKKIIERHHGQIWVESQPGLGSTFYFTIPERQP